MPDDQLESLLNKMSGYVSDDETILLLARYHYLQPDLLKKAKTRWPKLKLQFMTFHASKGQQADYVIILGLQSGKDGFPAPARESIIETALLPQLKTILMLKSAD
ncbi:DNA helicase IV [Proteus mirabilis]|uniref:DNA helicase IV n=1 Tax=Proteus mirabilis TaxID=584 RepID=A0A379FH60_PROMI|nr:DNA helicase IV [Proteus mirabilis]